MNAMGSPSKALVAFTDVVKDAKDGQEYTEAKMNDFPDAATGFFRFSSGTRLGSD